MKRIIFFINLIFIALCSFSQEIINNKITDKHKYVPGTKISLIPPTDFEPAKKFNGFYNELTNGSIMVLDIPGAYSEVEGGLTKDGFATQGIKIKEIEPVTINSMNGKFLVGNQTVQETTYNKLILVFGTQEETLMLNCTFLPRVEDLDDIISNSIKTVVYDPNMEINPFDNIGYTIDVSSSNLKFAKLSSGMLLYTEDGLMPTEAKDQTSLILGKAFDEVDIEDKKEFSLQRLHQLPIPTPTIREIKQVKIDNLSGYQVFADGIDQKTNQKVFVHQTILFTKSSYYIFIGRTNNGASKIVKQFDKIIKTFKRKA